ncbi:dTDP-4-dehydrorhamnose 3,5-epimerase [Paenibacillus sp.]|uniref:dTDP-4-dehydrorhamnose 3,5-epimerase n=1 Tax=Paenibacillus sp. TaxID=58172 RepID=UPI002D3FF21A|nr:dTDP-4-dehydrorhamnose 3,5-epimerase [Paenibacillus sp.]HZG86173.1 dTDP-4-dehydrorhamnose 3,5-epimerase [Paenibacillus sp.]
MFELKKTIFDGCYEMIPRVLSDQRGKFIKTFHSIAFSTLGLDFQSQEEYYSVSHKNVIRGLHFQIPPMDHKKIVYCVSGEVLDVVVDLRVGSPTYGQFQMFELNEAKANMIYIPSGLAHGFLTLSESAILLYKVTSVYSPEHDGGIHWNSIGIPWGVDRPIISDRDKSFPSLVDFESPFTF